MKQVSASSVLIALLAIGLISSQTAAANEYAAGWGPAVGTKVPVLAASDQSGAAQTLRTLTGKQGLLLFMNRSADW